MPRDAAPMRILVLTNMWPRPDAPHRGIFVARQVDGIRRLGIDVDLMLVDGYRTRFNYARAVFRVLALNATRKRYDLIHAHTGHCGLIACAQLRFPVVFSYVGYDLDVPAESFENGRTRIERLVFRYLSVFVAGTIAKSARGRRRIPRLGRARNELIPNGVDRRTFAPFPKDEARRRLGWAPDRPIVLFAADPTRFTKGFPLAEEVLTLVRERLPETELAIGAQVPPDEMPTWMNAADALLLTSVAEGSPNVVKEALMCDLPIVAVDVGDVRANVEGVRLSHVCPHDARRLADALTEVLGRRGERSDGRERSSHLDLEAISRRLSAFYAAAAARGPGLLGFVARWPRALSGDLGANGDPFNGA